MPAVRRSNQVPLPANPRPQSAAHQASPRSDAHRYQRHVPKQTLLYQIVAQHYPVLVYHMAAQGAAMPAHVQREFDDYLKCGRLEHGFLRCVARTVATSGWSRSAASAEDFARAAAPGAWPRARRCW